MTHPYASNRVEIQDTLDFIRKNSCYAVVDPASESRRAFIPLENLNTYFLSDRKAKLYNVLDSVFAGEDPPDADDIFPTHIRVFCILLEIGMGHYINLFTSSWDLNDQRLPQNPNLEPATFPKAPERPDFYKDFCDKQWRYCAADFSPPMSNIKFEEDRIIPIVQKDMIAGGGSAILYRIRIHSSYNKLGSGLKDSNNTLADTFVLKTYLTPDAETYYKSETEAFKRLKRYSDTNNFIGFYGSYRQGPTYNVILEYADKGTLESYFRETDPPVKEEDIINFWSSLFMIMKALTSLHDIEFKGIEGPQVLHGWHQDIKPANILVTSGGGRSMYEWQFKLADLGLSHFKKAMNGGESTAIDARGTQTYGAPECYREDEFLEKSPLQVKQSVDIWSVGCVLSEAVVWMAYGYQGLQTYRQRRKEETDKIRGFKHSDCFHNGESVLATVVTWHEDLIPCLRKSDYLTAAVVDLIQDTLQKSKYRLVARQLWGKSQRILEDARKRHTREMERPAINGTRSTSAPEPPQQPTGPPPPPPSQFTIQTPPRNSRKQSRLDSSVIAGAPREDSPESITTNGETSPHYGVNRDRPRRQTTRPVTQPPYPSHSRNSSSYSHHQTQQNYYQDPAISEEEQYDDFPDKIPGKGKEPARAWSMRVDQSQVESRRNRRSVPRFEAGFDQRSSLPILNSQNYFDESASAHIRGQSEGSQQIPASASSTTQTSYQQNSMRGVQAPPQRRPQEAQKSPRPPTPQLSVLEALQWRALKQQKFKLSSRQLPHEYLRERLAKRDHAFLVDNAGSMTNHWKELTSLVGLLAYIVKPFDSDGLEMFYTISSGEPVVSTNSSKLVKSLNKTQPSGISDISILLSQILEKYKSKLHNAFGAGYARTASFRNDLRPLSLYVLTDGTWQPYCDAESPIKSLVQKLVDLDITDRKQVGIQFISFGDNSEGLERMKILDSKMKVKGEKIKLDIVDTEPSNGNVWKMLLGAIDPWFDDDLDNMNEGSATTT